MASIIKSSQRPDSIRSAAFHFDDIAKNAEAYLENVRREAEKILDQARREGEAIRSQAKQEGLKSAADEIDKKADEKVRLQMQSLLPALEKIVQDIEHTKHQWLDHWERTGVHVAAAIAARVIRRELVHTPEIPLALIREALELAAGSPGMRLLLNPQDLAALGSGVEALTNQCGRLSAAAVVGDPSISPGGCRVETRFGIVDQQIETQLKRIEEELA